MDEPLIYKSNRARQIHIMRSKRFRQRNQQGIACHQNLMNCDHNQDEQGTSPATCKRDLSIEAGINKDGSTSTNTVITKNVVHNKALVIRDQPLNSQQVHHTTSCDLESQIIATAGEPVQPSSIGCVMTDFGGVPRQSRKRKIAYEQRNPIIDDQYQNNVPPQNTPSCDSDFQLRSDGSKHKDGSGILKDAYMRMLDVVKLGSVVMRIQSWILACPLMNVSIVGLFSGPMKDMTMRKAGIRRKLLVNCW